VGVRALQESGVQESGPPQDHRHWEGERMYSLGPFSVIHDVALLL